MRDRSELRTSLTLGAVVVKSGPVLDALTSQRSFVTWWLRSLNGWFEILLRSSSGLRAYRRRRVACLGSKNPWCVSAKGVARYERRDKPAEESVLIKAICKIVEWL